MNSLLLVIDMQEAFINKNTEYLIEKINNLISSKIYDKVIFTRFINKENSIFVNKLGYYGCIGKDKELVIDSKGNKVIDKDVYTALNDDLKKYIIDNNITKIYICGLDSDCCVLKTAFDLFEQGYDLYVLKDYCASSCGIEKNKFALQILKRNIGKDRVI